MQLLVFDLKGMVARFKRPDTTQTQATYPFVTRTALRGLIASILGLETPEYTSLAAVRLMRPVRKEVWSTSMLHNDFLTGRMVKKGNFNYLARVEWLVEPYYRIYYSGERTAELAEMIRGHRSVYPTYLGVAEAFTEPRFVGLYEAQDLEHSLGEVAEVSSVVPEQCIERIVPGPSSALADIGGVALGVSGTGRGAGAPARRFYGAIRLIYDRLGAPVPLVPREGPYDPQARLVRLPGEPGEAGETVCLY